MLKVMIVDDSTIIRKLLVKELNELGHTVVAEAKSGKDAIKMYTKYKPDLITMDITMPIMNGITALREIRKLSKDIKVIMITSRGEEKQVMDAISSGAKGYLLKPIKASDLEASIQKVFPDVQGTLSEE